MLKWITRFGCALVVVGAALLSPLADFLPVGAGSFLLGDFSQPGATHYYRVVTTDGAVIPLVPLALVSVGLVVAASTLLLRQWLRRR